MHKHIILPAALLLLVLGGAHAQTFTEWGTSDPSRTTDCGEYQWPEVSSACPEVQIKQKHDHTPLSRYRERGWDTVVTCSQRELTLSCMPYIPTQLFNGKYTVDEIPYAPADPTFHSGSALDNSSDDRFCALQQLPQSTANGARPFPFYFFGYKKTSFVAGGNGIISFNTAAANQSCAYGIYDPLPWTGSGGFGTNLAGSGVDRHRDAIYGVFQDTDPSCNTNPPQGIWYDVRDSFPCRKIIASYNDLPWFSCGSNANNRQKYQIICYEGSNIIEVHIARRTVSNSSYSWCFNGVIGIQNATGEPQVTGAPGTTTMAVHSGAHAAYYPASTNAGNVGTTTITEKAYRFTPQGETEKVYGWYRIRPEGGPNDTLPTIDDGIHSYYEIMQGDDRTLYDVWDSAPCPSLTKAYIRNVEQPTRFVFFLKFFNANGEMYDLADTIFVGVDNDNTLSLHGSTLDADNHVYDICAGNTGHISLDFPALNDTVRNAWVINRISMGQQIPLNFDDVLTPDGLTIIGDSTADGSIKSLNYILKANLPTEGVMENKIDSIAIQVSTDFSNGCDSNSTLLVRIFPNFDTTEAYAICRGETFHWEANGNNYSETTRATALLHSQPGCDSVVHLDLTAMDVSYNIDHISDCKPITWNGNFYTESNTATALSDTVRLVNRWGCDSIVQLEFTLFPLTALIHTDIDHFSYDNLNVELTDISIGGGTRQWIFPNGSIQSGSTAYYTIPQEADSATIILVAHSPYDCTDTTQVTLPFNKETFWLPNAFTPGNTAGNNLFGSTSRNTLTEEMVIFNRRGEMVFHCEQVDCTWDGRDLDGTPCPQGAYVYVVRYTNRFEPDRTRLVKGTVTLIR